jgi:hypothetical protein
MGGDSNPRYLLGTHAFQACALDHSATHPCTAVSAFGGQGGKIVRQIERSASPMCAKLGNLADSIHAGLTWLPRMAATPAGVIHFADRNR